MRDLSKVQAGRRDFAKAAGLAGLAVLVGIGVAFWLLLPASPPAEESGDVKAGRVAERAVESADRVSGGERVGEQRQRAGDDATRAAEELIGDPGCRIHRGIGPARGAAVAVVASSADSRFAVVDAAGVAFAGDVPFRVERTQLGRRQDGALVAAFGTGGDQRLAVFLDGRMLAQERNVVDFGLARDGAEWFLVRPEDGEGFRVERRDTVSGARRSFTLTRMRDTGFGLSHTASYSPVANELIFEPLRPDDSYDNAFILRSSEGKTRLVGMQAVQALVESNAHLYVLENWRGQHSITKQAFRWGAKPGEGLVDVWSRAERIAPETVRMFLSDDAAWLGLFGWRLVVFDAASGEPVLEFPLRGDKQAEFARLRPVLAANATIADVGQATDARFAHGMLLLRRTVRARSAAQASGSVQVVDEVVDVFRMDGLGPDSQPEVRVAADDLYRCMVARAGFPLPAMRVDESGVVYGSPRQAAGAIRPVPKP